MKIIKLIHPLLSLLLCAAASKTQAIDFSEQGEYVGSSDCRPCHERFYKLWSTSHHGTAMQAFSLTLTKTLTPMTQPIQIGDTKFIIEFTKDGGTLTGINDKGEQKTYPIRHALGGRNVFFFLVPVGKGKLQVAPLAYYVHKQLWYNATESMIRHFEIGPPDQALDWTDRMLTFNTACHDCHVSQLDKNYAPETDSYLTTWKEAGINCETCHGPSEAHIKAAKEAAKNHQELKDPKLISFHKDLDLAQRNATCGPCHAKMSPLTRDFTPGEQFFDHYSLISYENRDFYPDGRDLGENYTQTGWMANPCANSGQLECIHCHTSSGRFRFKDNPNQSCIPCHEERVKTVTEHSHHKENEGSICINCHMPVTAQSYMTRSDHSFRPPSPAASLAFGSPNACTLCHNDKDAQWSNKINHKKEDVEWANKYVVQWFGSDAQKPILKLGHIIQACREGEWEKLPEILTYLQSTACDQPSKVAIIRLLSACPAPEKWPTTRKMLLDPSPWVRAAAAAELQFNNEPITTDLLLKATQDPFRSVRIYAASSLLGRNLSKYSPTKKEAYKNANKEYWNSLIIWPDRWDTYYNQGLYFDRINQDEAALYAYSKATKLRADMIPPIVNAALIHAKANRNEDAYKLLQKGLFIEPENATLNFNIALLEAEMKNLDATEKHLRIALKSDPQLAQAAYNLGILLGQNKNPEAFVWLEKAAILVPQSWNYTATLLYFNDEFKRKGESEKFLNKVINTKKSSANAYSALARIMIDQDRTKEAAQLFHKMKTNQALPIEARRYASQMEQQLVQ